MALRNTNNQSRNRNYRRSGPNRGGRQQGLVTRAQAKQMFKSMLHAQVEDKIYELGGSGATAQAGAVTSITQPIVQGTTDAGRIGSVITVKSLDMRFTFKVDDSSTGKGQLVRFIVFKDTMNQGAIPAVTAVLSAATITSAYTTSEYEQNRYITLHDQTVPLSINGPSSVSIHRKIRVNAQVSYLGTGNAAASNGRNSLYILILTDQAATFPTFVSDFLITYTDL